MKFKNAVSAPAKVWAKHSERAGRKNPQCSKSNLLFHQHKNPTFPVFPSYLLMPSTCPSCLKEKTVSSTFHHFYHCLVFIYTTFTLDKVSLLLVWILARFGNTASRVMLIRLDVFGKTVSVDNPITASQYN